MRTPREAGEREAPPSRGPGVPEGQAAELARLEAAYRDRDRSRLNAAYTLANPAFRFHLEERERALLRALADVGGRLAGARVLEVGSGTGHILGRFLEWGASEAVGVDLMPGRLQASRHAHPRVLAVRGNAGRLPFPDGAFDVVAQFMCVSSVLDPTLRRDILLEMWRATRPGGVFLSYDLRPLGRPSRWATRWVGRLAPPEPRPPPPAAGEALTPTRPLGLAELAAAVPLAAGRHRTVSLDFGLAGHAARRPRLAALLARLPPLRTHRLVALRKPGGG